MSKGVFITLEGPDGAGKTTSMDFLVTTLESLGYRVVRTREPGGTPLGEDIRSLLLHRKMSIRTEIALFAAARLEHLEEVIFPGINRGEIVISDRFTDSSYAYQGGGRGATQDVLEIEQWVLKGFRPDYTLFFDIPQTVSQERLNQRLNQSDRFDQEFAEFKTRVWHAYQERFQQHPERMVRVNANQQPEDVNAELLKWIQEVLLPKHPPPLSY